MAHTWLPPKTCRKSKTYESFPEPWANESSDRNGLQTWRNSQEIRIKSRILTTFEGVFGTYGKPFHLNCGQKRAGKEGRNQERPCDVDNRKWPRSQSNNGWPESHASHKLHAKDRVAWFVRCDAQRSPNRVQNANFNPKRSVEYDVSTTIRRTTPLKIQNIFISQIKTPITYKNL